MASVHPALPAAEAKAITLAVAPLDPVIVPQSISVSGVGAGVDGCVGLGLGRVAALGPVRLTAGAAACAAVVDDEACPEVVAGDAELLVLQPATEAVSKAPATRALRYVSFTGSPVSMGKRGTNRLPDASLSRIWIRVQGRMFASGGEDVVEGDHREIAFFDDVDEFTVYVGNRWVIGVPDDDRLRGEVLVGAFEEVLLGDQS